MIKNIRVMLLVACLACLTAALFANGQNETAAQGTPEVQLCSTDSWWGTARDPEMQKAVAAYLGTKAGVTLKEVIVPNATYKEKLNTLIAAGQTPDVFRVMQAMNYIPGYAVQGDILPLDSFIAKSAAASKVPAAYYDYLRINGKVYHIPFQKPMHKFLWFRKDLIDKYGVTLKATMTTDEFYNAMKKVVDSGAREVPLTFPKFIDNLQFFYNAFGAYANIYPVNGKYIDGFNTPEIKEALQYIKKLYDAKILDQEFVRNENNKMRENLYKGLTLSDIDYFNRYGYYMAESEKAGTPSDFIPVYTLVGPKGKKGTLNEAIQDAWVISSKTKNPAAAFKLIETILFNADALTVANIGLEGMHYEIKDGVATSIEKAKTAGHNMNAGFIFTSFIDNLTFKFKWDAATEKSFARQVVIAKEAEKYTGPNYAIPAWKSSKLEQVNLSIKTKREEIASAIVLGTKTMDEGFAEYNQYWKSIDGDGILAECNK